MAMLTGMAECCESCSVPLEIGQIGRCDDCQQLQKDDTVEDEEVQP